MLSVSIETRRILNTLRQEKTRLNMSQTILRYIGLLQFGVLLVLGTNYSNAFRVVSRLTAKDKSRSQQQNLRKIRKQTQFRQLPLLKPLNP